MNEWTKKADGTVLKSLGEQNFERQVTQFVLAGYPYYYILDGNEKSVECF